jgi:hypothetical protein
LSQAAKVEKWPGKKVREKKRNRGTRVGRRITASDAGYRTKRASQSARHDKDEGKAA